MEDKKQWDNMFKPTKENTSSKILNVARISFRHKYKIKAFHTNYILSERIYHWQTYAKGNSNLCFLEQREILHMEGKRSQKG